MSEAIVELRDVFCVHRTNEGDTAALVETNLELSRGEVLCVLGPSGAGKSTLLRVVAGLQPPSAGVVVGRDIGRMPAHSRSRIRHELMGFLGQHTDTALNPDLRMRDAVALPLALRGVPRRERRRRVDELFGATALADRADVRPAELSGGERQRFALCAALAHRPALLLADEPTGELDDASADAIRTLIVELAHTYGTGVILVIHDPATAGLVDRTLRIRDGRIVSDRRGREKALVVDGWLRLPPDLLTRAGIGRRARVQPTSDGVIVTWAVSDSGPAAADGTLCPVRVELRSVARSYRHGLTRCHVLGGLTHDFAPGRMTAITGRWGWGRRRC
jgi:ABC-type lipoprotein export system ATPase subunit